MSDETMDELNEAPTPDYEEEGEPEEATVAEDDSAVESSEADDAAAVDAGPRLVLKRSGQETEIEFPFTAPAVVGRFDPSVGPIDIDLGQIEEGAYVSRRHARLTFEDGGYLLSDLGSSNGTYVLRDEFEKIEECELNDGDEIAFGNARFVFRS